MNYAKRILSLLPVLAMLLTLSPTVFATYLPFTDVPAGSWYRDSVEYVWENELMSGTSSSTFSPDTNMTRAMLVTVLYRLDGSPEDFTISPFVDVPFEAYYYKPVVWAYKNGIVSGTGAHTFSPNANITREQLVAIFCRYANYKGSDTPATADLTGYVDYGRVSVYAREPFQWAVGCGIVSGTSIAILSPQGTATRAQCATIMHRFIQWTEAAVTPTPSPIPTIDPTMLPSMAPTLRPTLMPIPVPTSVPTQFPSPMDTPEPTSLPTLQPTPEVPFPEVDESKLVKENGNSAKTITITTNQFLEIEYTNREWGSMYHTFEWTITAGEDILLMDEGYDSAVFAPLAAGEASVKLRYGYTKEEPDVLTGIMRDKAKSKTRTYTIIIEEPTQTE